MDCDIVEVSNEYLPYMYMGTGDVCCLLFAGSCYGGTLTAGSGSIRWRLRTRRYDCICQAVQFRDRGVSFEPVIG